MAKAETPDANVTPELDKKTRWLDRDFLHIAQIKRSGQPNVGSWNLNIDLILVSFLWKVCLRPNIHNCVLYCRAQSRFELIALSYYSCSVFELYCLFPEMHINQTDHWSSSIMYVHTNSVWLMAPPLQTPICADQPRRCLNNRFNGTFCRRGVGLFSSISSFRFDFAGAARKICYN